MIKSTELNTVNVIEYVENCITGIRSFPDTPKGNKEAEELFKQCIIENRRSDIHTDFSTYLEDGYWICGSYELYLAHSGKVEI